MADYKDGFWWSNDGLRLHYRDYAGPSDRPPIFCFHGLTRNARDFDALASRLAGTWRLICPEMRGRADSAYAKDPMTYAPLTYLQDIERLLADLAVSRFVAFGTSLGGILTMLLAATRPERIAGALLNDIGPVIEQAGLERIKGYVGSGGSYPTWVHAARALGENNADIYPRYGLEDWLGMAKRLYRLTSGGRIVLDYDMRIAEPLRMPGGEAGVDLWPTLEALKDVPVLLVRGERSDLLSEATVRNMAARLSMAKIVTVPDVGHAPVLDEPEAAEGVDWLLQQILQGV